MDVAKEYRWEKGGVVADWICPICRRIIYPETSIHDIPEERLKRECEVCERALDEADNLATEWWEAEGVRRRAAFGPEYRAYYASSTHGTKGTDGLRDDLVDYLVRGKVSGDLKGFLRRSGQVLPTQKR